MLGHVAPEAYADYARWWVALERAVPALVAPPFGHPYHRLDEVVLALWGAAYTAGLRVGAAGEHLRLALVGPTRACPRCHAGGVLWGGSPYRHRNDGANGETCPVCGGAGTVPTPAPSLHLTAD